MESLFISSLFNIVFAIALGIIGYILYGMSKNVPVDVTPVIESLEAKNEEE